MIDFDRGAPVREIVIATRNRHKLIEMRELLDGLDVRVRGLDEFPHLAIAEETGATFEENAQLKAESVARSTGLVALADDSGLMVDALGGLPGVMSARYAGRDGDHAANNAKLLRELAGVEAASRTARFVCVIAVAAEGRKTEFFRGECSGLILEEPRGSGGFGYDPLFYCPELGKTFAEAYGQKQRLSHRARAMAAFVEAFRQGRFDGWFEGRGRT